MSYDLFFRSRSPGGRLSLDDFVRYFAGRPRYEVKGSQAWYSNEVSGVYFSFDYSEPSDDPEAEEERDSSLLPVSFNLNYFRPHPFGLEAEPEVGAFIEAFDLTVSDLQRSGMGDGDYSKKGFLSGWNDGNEFGYRAILSRDPTQEFLTLPSDQIESIWRWNFDREARQHEVGDGGFVPRIFFFNAKGEVQTGVAWGEGIPILLPVVDLVLVPRQRLARRSEDMVVFTWRELEPITRRFRKASRDPEAYELFYEDTPADVERAIREKQPPAEVPKGVAFDQVLDRELVDRARGR